VSPRQERRILIRNGRMALKMARDAMTPVTLGIAAGHYVLIKLRLRELRGKV
jgi:hypothetical protein